MFSIECAVKRDMTSPVDEYLDRLENGDIVLRAPENVREEHQDSSLPQLAWFYAICDHVAEYGTPPRQNTHNQLRDGIWEFKPYNLRIAFFDTDGTGKNHSTVRESITACHWNGRPWPEVFLPFLRLTTCFEKTSQQTPEWVFSDSQTIREEDLEHDRNDSQKNKI